MNNIAITTGPKNFRIENRAGVEYITLGNPERVAEIVADFFGESLLYGTVLDYLDAGCELVDVERDESDGCIIINALKNGCDVGEFNASLRAKPDDVDLLVLFADGYNFNN